MSNIIYKYQLCYNFSYSIKYLILIFLLTLKSQFTLTAQQLSYIHYTDKNGLPSNEIYGIQTDDKGYLWIVTDKGVSKYDGTKFTNYTSRDGLTDNVFFNITANNSNKLWLWAYNKRLSYIENGKFYNYQYNYLIKKITNSLQYTGLQVAENGKGVVFIHCNSKFFSITKTGIVDSFSKIIFGNKIIITQKIIANKTIYKNEGDIQIPIEHIEKDNWFIDINNIDMYYHSSNWFLFHKGNEIFEFKNGKRKIHYMLSRVESFCVDNTNCLWVSLFGINKLLRFSSLDSAPTIILQNSSGKVIKDKIGNIWFSNSYSGLYKFPNNFISFYTTQRMNTVSAIIAVEKTLYLGDYSGNYFSLSNKGLTQKYVLDFDLIKNKDILSKINFGSDLKIETYGTFALSANSINLGGRCIQRLNTDLYFCSGPISNSLFQTNPFKLIEKYEPKLDVIKDACMINSKLIYFATISGAFVLENGQSNNIFKNSNMQGEHFQCVKRINNFLIFGTKGSGIVIYDIDKKEKVFNYHSANSLIPNSINCLYVNNNDLWIGTNKGIYLCKFNDGKIKYVNQINSNNGLAFNDVLGLCLIKNHLYASSMNYINKLNLSNTDLLAPTIPNKPEITKIQINDSLISVSKNIITEYGENDYEIYFNTPQLTDKSRIKYVYKLEGYDKQWRTTSDDRVRYRKLPSGNYTFKIYTSLDDGILISPESFVSFQIKEPFWKKIWFKIALGFFILILLFAGILIFQYNKNKQNKRKRQIVELQQQAVRAQLNPHFIFNTLNSIQNFVIKSKLVEATDFIEKFAKLTRYVLDTTQTELMPIHTEIEILKNYLAIEKERFKNFDYSIDIQTDELLQYKIPTMLLQPIVENSIWHGLSKKNTGGLLTITLHINPKIIQIEIEDNGVGRIEHGMTIKHKSKGLGLIKKRLEFLNSNHAQLEIIDLLDTKNNPTGTKVIISIPKIN